MQLKQLWGVHLAAAYSRTPGSVATPPGSALIGAFQGLECGINELCQTMNGRLAM